MQKNSRHQTGKYTAQEVTQIVQTARNTLLGNVTYTLLTPLTTIRSLAETLQDDMVKDEKLQHTYYREIIREAKQLEQMVADLMELSKLQSNCVQLKKASVRGIDIFGPVLERYLVRFADPETNLDIERLNPGAIPFLHTDADHLIRLINILLDNSVKFAGKNGTVSVSSEIGSTHIVFCIRSNGFRIPEENLENIFNCLCKADAGCYAVENPVEFAIAGQIAKGLDEKLWAESTVGVGTSFYFTVKIAEENLRIS